MSTQDLYPRLASDNDRKRGRNLFEEPCLHRMLAEVLPGGRVFDLGRGLGGRRPIGAHLAACGCAVTGVDFATAMLDLQLTHVSGAQILPADMRGAVTGGTIRRRPRLEQLFSPYG